MSSLVFKAILAGVFFGIWPLLMSRSGLSGSMSAAAFTVISLAIVLPFALHQNGLAIPTANWYMVISAGVLAGVALLFFNSMLSGATPQNVGQLFIINLAMQIAMPAIYNTIMNGGVSIRQVCGYASVGLAVWLLRV